MKKTLLMPLTLIMLALLTGCGTFKIEGQIVASATPTSLSGEEINADAESGAAASGILNLRQILALLSLFAASILVTGTYFLIRQRTPEADYAPIKDLPDGGKSIAQLIRFKPNFVSLILTLFVWTGIIGIVAILIIVGLLLGQDAFTAEWEPALTHPSSILIGANDPHIRLVPETESCLVRSRPNESWDLMCDLPFAGASLTINAMIEEGLRWSCNAAYDGRPVPCRASFDAQDGQTFIVVENDLGLSEDRYRQLVAETINVGWNEQDWIWLARGLVAVLALGLLGLLWRHSAKYAEDDFPARVMRVVYSAGISLVFFLGANYVSFVALLVFNLID